MRIKMSEQDWEDEDCPECRFNKDGACYNYEFKGNIACQDISCEFKTLEPYNYPKKEVKQDE